MGDRIQNEGIKLYHFLTFSFTVFLIFSYYNEAVTKGDYGDGIYRNVSGIK